MDQALGMLPLSAGTRNELQPISFYQRHLEVNAQSPGVRESSFFPLATLPALCAPIRNRMSSCWSSPCVISKMNWATQHLPWLPRASSSEHVPMASSSFPWRVLPALPLLLAVPNLTQVPPSRCFSWLFPSCPSFPWPPLQPKSTPLRLCLGNRDRSAASISSGSLRSLAALGRGGWRAKSTPYHNSRVSPAQGCWAGSRVPLAPGCLGELPPHTAEATSWPELTQRPQDSGHQASQLLPSNSSEFWEEKYESTA